MAHIVGDRLYSARIRIGTQSNCCYDLAMNRVFFAILLTAMLPIAAAAQSTPSDFIRFEEVRIIEGDDPRFATPGFDDANWARTTPEKIDPQGRIMWVRAHIDGDGLAAAAAEQPLGFFLSALASREIFLNGVSIGASGAPGATPDDETPGALDAVFFIPSELLRSDRNVFAIRISSHHLGARVGWPIHSFHIAPYESPTRRRLQSYIPAIAAGGAIALGAFYFLGFYASNRRDASSLALGILAFAVIAQLAAESWRAFDFYLYPLHMLRLYLMLGFALIAGGALSVFSGLRFAPQRTAQISALAFIVSGFAIFLAPGYDSKLGLIILTFMIAALVAALIGARNQKRGAFLSSIGFAIFLAAAIAAPYQFLDQTYYLAMAALIIVLFATQVRLLSVERRAREEAALQTVRLRHELLKKQIQPHFLMNTLTTLSEWIELEPKTGVAMIDALSRELRLLYDISDKTLISLADELELCRQHLKVMSLRADAVFSLQIEGGMPDIQCPPAVLLTLIENAFTHNEYRDSAEFEVKATLSGKDITILCRAPTQATSRMSSQNGTGLAYIRARLKEAFGDEWSLESAPTHKFWETVINWRSP